jgi:hypothetical protein
MSLRIGFDLDGVLADLDGALIRHSTELFGARAPADAAQDSAESSPTDAGNAPVDRQREVWRHVGRIENFWEQLGEIETGATARLAALASERRWEIIFLTKRHKTMGVTAQLQSQRWLERMGFPYPSVFIVRRSRGAIAAALGLDAVVDDRPENCVDVAVDSSARSILVMRGAEVAPAAARKLDISLVRSVEEACRLLIDLDTRLHKPAKLFDRLKQLVISNTRRAQGGPSVRSSGLLAG